MQLVVHERYRFFHYLNTSFINVASVGSAVSVTRKVYLYLSLPETIKQNATFWV